MNALANTAPLAANDQDELRAAIKKFGILEPRPDDGQGDVIKKDVYEWVY